MWGFFMRIGLFLKKIPKKRARVYPKKITIFTLPVSFTNYSASSFV
jgi:hypothetical protein